MTFKDWWASRQPCISPHLSPEILALCEMLCRHAWEESETQAKATAEALRLRDYEELKRDLAKKEQICGL